MAQTACVHPRPRGGHQGGHWVGARSGDWREVALRDEGCLTGPVQAMYRRKSVDQEATLARSYSNPDEPEQSGADNGLRSTRPRSKHTW
jgi:hypothetical protein